WDAELWIAMRNRKREESATYRFLYGTGSRNAKLDCDDLDQSRLASAGKFVRLRMCSHQI
ncbi:hypothetical protein REH81_10490, partial [Vibrio rotiferianus]